MTLTCRKVAELLIDDNRAVRSGDVLLRIDPRDYAARRDQAKAAVAVAAAAHQATRSETQLTRETTAAQVDEAREAEKRVFEEKAREEGKPDDVVEKIVEGQLSKWASEVALLDQAHVKDRKSVV